MEYRAFGKAGFDVSVIGLGAGHIGSDQSDESDVEQLLNGALDLGINLIDTARGYGRSEERIGRYLSHRRKDLILSTKIGYGIDGFSDWSPPIITAGISEALQRCRTDYIDIVHLHSCPIETLRNSDILHALQKEVEQGRVRVAAYSGENEALMYAASSGVFGSIQCSVNIADQRSIDTILPMTVSRGMGVIAKRPVANIAWRFRERPVGEYAEVYWTRIEAMRLDPTPLSWMEMALRFTVSVPGVHSCIIGTGKLDHLKHNVELAANGKLPKAMYQRIRNAFMSKDRQWTGEV